MNGKKAKLLRRMARQRGELNGGLEKHVTRFRALDQFEMDEKGNKVNAIVDRVTLKHPKNSAQGLYQEAKKRWTELSDPQRALLEKARQQTRAAHALAQAQKKEAS